MPAPKVLHSRVLRLTPSPTGAILNVEIGQRGLGFAGGGADGLIVAFPLLTYFAPRFFLFEDPLSHQYGILDGME